MKRIEFKDLLPWALVAVALFFLWKEIKKEPQVEYVPVEVEVQVPVKEHVFDTIYMPKPVPVKETVIDSTYYEEYVKLKDSVEKDSMFKEAIKIREYTQKFEDTVQTINVYSKTRGELLAQTVDYETKPYTITVKDTIKVPNRFKVYAGVEVGIPVAANLNINGGPVAKVNLMIKPKNRENFWTAGIDTEGRVWAGKTWKISFRGKNKKN